MKEYPAQSIRNVALLGGGGSGKTTLAEAMLFAAKAIEKLGSVMNGTSTMDYEPEEIARKSSTTSSVGFYEWKGQKVNIVDTPGSISFLEDVKAALRVVDGAVLVVSAATGIKGETEKVWSFASSAQLPCLAFISEMDKERANHSKTLADLKKAFGLEPILLTLPVGAEASFSGVVDLLSGKSPEAEDIRRKAIETIAESNDALLEKYLEKGDLTQDEIAGALRDGTLRRAFLPVFCGSALKNIGVQVLMDMITLSLPSPVEKARLTPVSGTHPSTGQQETREPTETAPFSAVVFKTIIDPFSGRLSYFRVLSGKLTADAPFYNATRKEKEKGGHLFAILGKKYLPVQKVSAGDIAAVAKLKDTMTGDTLCDEHKPIAYQGITFVKPVLSYAIEPKARDDEEKVSISLTKLVEEDPTLEFQKATESKEMILSGMGQLHLDVVVEKLKRKFGVEVTIKTPKVPYRETVRRKVEVQGRYKKQTGGHGHFADTWIRLEPVPRSTGYKFVDQIKGGAIPRQFITYVDRGVQEAMHRGVLAGFPVVDVMVTLYDGSYHPVDSGGPDFEIAASMGFKKAMTQAEPVLLEPVMAVEVSVHDNVLGAVIGDLNGRRGRVAGVEPSGSSQTIKAQVPLAEMLKYAPTLSSLTAGRGTYSMEFSHYEEVPAHIVPKVVAEYTPKEAEKVEEE